MDDMQYADRRHLVNTDEKIWVTTIKTGCHLATLSGNNPYI